MKKILTILGTITLIGTSTTSLVACNTPQYTEEQLKEQKEKHKINTDKQEIKDNLEWILAQEKPFNQIDNKYYFVVWRDSKNSNWNINKFNNNKEIILITGDTRLQKTKFGSEYDLAIRVPEIKNMSVWKEDDRTYFKSVYRWNNNSEPNTPIIDPKTGQITNWNLKQQNNINKASCTMNRQKTTLVRLFFYFYIKKHKFICIIHRIVSLNLELLS